MKIHLQILVVSVTLLASASAFAKNPLLPDPKLTKGKVTSISADTLCQKSFHTKDERFVTDAMKKRIFAKYGITSHKPREYEIDHLISLELGGSNDESNLWPQSYVTEPWNAHVKDQLETRLHWMICNNQITLQQAQNAIRKNWINAYKKYISPTPLAKLPRPTVKAAAIKH